MLIYNSSTEALTALDFRETAPGGLNVSKLKKSEARGTRSIGIPGQLKGLHVAKTRFGSPDISWEELFTDAKAFASYGNITNATIDAADSVCETLILDDRYRGNPTYDNAREFLKCKNDVDDPGSELREERKLEQPGLRKTLDMIAKDGSDSFYNSAWTSELVSDLIAIVGSSGTDITVQDFNDYQVEERSVISSTYKDYTVYGVGPPASGAIMALLLNVMDGLDLQQRDSTTFFNIIEALKSVCPEILKLGDPDYNTGNQSVAMEVETLLSSAKATEVLQYIQNLSGSASGRTSCWDSSTVGQGSGSGSTTHLSVVDGMGNAVSVTSTINQYFGNLVFSKDHGIFFNNQLDDFNNIPGYPANAPEANKRPRSAAVPTIILKSDMGLKLVTGAAGGQTIPAGVLQTILGVLNFGEDLQTATDATRVYVKWDGTVGTFTTELENDRNSAAETSTWKTELKDKGEDVKSVSSLYRAVVQSVHVNEEGKLFPYSDGKRKPGGKSAGYRRRRRHQFYW